ncbi:MAG: tetratricopeptide repeat protein, partial [Chloroflexi bacterium]|nr:tetratricopeptide repeat protein [Chloroflexota bacterium]
MPEVTLQSYGEEMRRLVAEGQYDQAIAMGRHLLRLYPKHLQTYRILGEACLEKGKYEEAHGLFARALACDPEDLFSRVGIAVAHEKQGNLNLAIWHLERAYELSPGNAELRKELQRLQAQRGEGARARLKLTSAAVARLYARSGLWRQAIQEFRTLLEQNPDLVDIKVALAEALWRSDQRKEAVKVCEEILAQYPHCLKANLILGEIGLRGERESEGRALLQLAQDIDPENNVAQKLFGDRSPLPARVVKIPSPEEMPAPAPESEVLITEEEIPPEALPDWLRESPLEPLRESEPPAPAEEAVTAAEAAPEAPAPSPEEVETEEGIPDWLRRIRERQKEEETQAAGPVGEVQEEVPEWMADLGQEEAVSEAPPTEELEELPLGEEEAQAAVSEEGIPDWLKQLEAEAGIAEGAPAAEAAPPEPLPEWLVGEPEAAPPEVSEPTEIDLEALLAEAGLAQTPAAEEVAEAAPEAPAPAAEEVAEAAPEAPAPAA